MPEKVTSVQLSNSDGTVVYFLRVRPPHRQGAHHRASISDRANVLIGRDGTIGWWSTAEATTRIQSRYSGTRTDDTCRDRGEQTSTAPIETGALSNRIENNNDE